jgi:hypothetical protein
MFFFSPCACAPLREKFFSRSQSTVNSPNVAGRNAVIAGGTAFEKRSEIIFNYQDSLILMYLTTYSRRVPPVITAFHSNPELTLNNISSAQPQRFRL